LGVEGGTLSAYKAPHRRGGRHAGRGQGTIDLLTEDMTMLSLLRTALLTVLVLVLVVFGGGGFYYSTQLLDPGMPGDVPRDVKVTGAEDGTVTLRELDAPPWVVADLQGGADVGFAHDRGYLRLLDPPTDVAVGTDVTAAWSFEEVAGSLPPVGEVGTVEVRAFPEDPTVLGLPVADVTTESDLGTFPAWVFPGTTNAEHWIVFTHGRGGSRGESLRAVDHVVGELGYSALVITHRNDPGAPPSPDGNGHFGDTEWQDLQLWLTWLVENESPAEITLFGFSQGASVTASCLRRCDDTSLVTGAILDSPLLSINETLDLQAAERGIPAVMIPPLLTATEWIADLRGGPDFGNLEHVGPMADLDLPILAFHGTEDLDVPISPTRALAALDPEQVTVVEYEGRHVRGWNVDREAYDAALTAFLQG
jgi:dienelactone hydrolase